MSALVADSCFMENRRGAADAQLVASLQSLIRIIEMSGDDTGMRVAQLPAAVAAMQRDLANVSGLSTFGSAVTDMHVRYSLRDGWNMPDLRTLLNLGRAMGWIRIVSGSRVVLELDGRRALATLPMSPRERLAASRATGTAPTIATSTA